MIETVMLAELSGSTVRSNSVHSSVFSELSSWEHILNLKTPMSEASGGLTTMRVPSLSKKAGRTVVWPDGVITKTE